MKIDDLEHLRMYLEGYGRDDIVREIEQVGCQNVWALFVVTQNIYKLEDSSFDNLIGYSLIDVSLQDIFENPFDSYQSLFPVEIDHENKRVLFELDNNEKT